MKKVSVKIKITVWYTILMLIITVVSIGFSTVIVRSHTDTSARNTMVQIMQENARNISFTDGTLTTGEAFVFYKSGVYTLIYSAGGTLMAGQLPVAFSMEEQVAFENRAIRAITAGNDDYYLIDLWYPSGWEDGLWIRGIMEVPEGNQNVQNMVLASLIVLPFLVLLSTIGGYVIAKRAFRPLDEIIKTAGAINEATDLSARVKLPDGNNEFTTLATTFNQMISRLERSFETEKQFTADASHELRTPLSVIKGACEYAEKYDETAEERAETIAMIHRQTEKMYHLITELLSITRLDQGTEHLVRQEIHIKGFLETMIKEQGYPPEQILIELPERASLLADPHLFGRLAQNLIENALKYGKEGGHVWITCEETDTEQQLVFRDDGIGISKENLEQIWKRFYQVDPSRSGSSGAGLGLSMVQKIAEAHGGYMTVESVPGIGSRFILHLKKSEN